MKHTQEIDQTKKESQDPAYEQFYTRILADLRTISDQESTASLPYKWAIGKRIFQARNELMSIRPVKNEKGWTKELGDLTERLSKELDYGKTTLSHCYTFYKKNPDWNMFFQTEFEVHRGFVNGVENSAEVKGQNLSWNEVIALVRDEKVKTSKSRVRPSSASSEGANSLNTEPTQFVTFQVPTELWETFGAIVRNGPERMEPEQMLPRIVETWVADYLGKNTL